MPALFIIKMPGLESFMLGSNPTQAWRHLNPEVNASKYHVQKHCNSTRNDYYLCISLVTPLVVSQGGGAACSIPRPPLRHPGYTTEIKK